MFNVHCFVLSGMSPSDTHIDMQQRGLRHCLSSDAGQCEGLTSGMSDDFRSPRFFYVLKEVILFRRSWGLPEEKDKLMSKLSKIELARKINSVESELSLEKLSVIYGKAKQLDKNKNDFSKLVEEYGHVPVNNTFWKIWNRDTSIAMIYKEEMLVSCGAIKDPFPEHRRKALSHIDIKTNDNDINYELGWIVTHPDHQGKGYCCYLIDYLLKKTPNVFATVRIDNNNIMSILKGFCFLSKMEPFRFNSNGNDVYSFYHIIEK